ncbi:MAG: TolC family protein [Acidobacteria bacterium]|nr:TolC family protein [Acidobacteriota bacterium]
MNTFIRVASFLALWAASASAQPAPQPLTLEDCIRRAQAAQSNVTIARQQAAIAHYGRIQANANFLPQLSLGGLYGYNSPLPSDRSTFSYLSANGIREYSTLGNIGLELDTSGRLRAQLARAKADEAAAAANLILSERDLKRAVSMSYYRVLLARRLVQVARDNLAEAQAFEARSRLLVDNQEVARADLIKASSQVAFFEQAVNGSELEAKLANHDLASFWTQDVEGPLPLADVLADPLPLPESQPPSAAPYLHRPEFRLFEAQKQGFSADARRARAELLPQLSLVQQYGFDSTRFSFADRGYATFVQLRVPVFDWFRARSATRQSELQANQVEVNRQMAERAFSKEYRDALARVDLLYSQIAIAERQVKLSEDNLRLSRVRYEGGEGLALDVVAAQTQLAQARVNYFTAKANYLSAHVDLEVTAGK